MFWAWRSPLAVLRRTLRVIMAELALIRSAQQTAAHRDEQILEYVMTNQSKIDDLSAQLSTAAEGLRADVADLKAQVAAGTPAEELDFSALESKVAALTELDSETTQAGDVSTPEEQIDPLV